MRTASEKRRAAILWAATALWMGLCLFLSWQPGEETTTLSGEIAQAVHRVIRLFGFEVDITIIHSLLRKLAHPAVFFVAGVLLCWATTRSLPRGLHRTALACLIAALAVSALAVLAEAGKLWIPGRHLQWDETLLDVAGAVCGSVVAWVISRLRKDYASYVILMKCLLRWKHFGSSL